MLTHPIASIPLYGSILLERAAYYGVRACFVLYLISGSVNMSDREAFKFYGMAMSVLAISYLFGGLFGLLKQPRILALCGLGIQFLGVLLLAISSHKINALVGFGALAFGSGFVKPNLYALFGQLYGRSKLLDSSMTMSYVAVNLGAFIGVWFISLAHEGNGFQYAFALSAVLLAAAFGLVLIAKPAVQNEVREPEKSNYSPVFIPIIIIAAIIASLLFWVNFDAIGWHLMTFEYESEAFTNLDQNFYTGLNFPVILITGIVLALLYSFKQVSTSLQFTIGFLVAALSFYVLFGLEDKFNAESQSLVSTLILYYVLQSVVEILIQPITLAFIVRKVELQFAPLVLAGYFSVTAFGLQLFSEPTTRTFYGSLQIALWTMLVFAMIFATIYFLINNEKSQGKNRADQMTIYPEDDALV